MFLNTEKGKVNLTSVSVGERLAKKSNANAKMVRSLLSLVFLMHSFNMDKSLDARPF